MVFSPIWIVGPVAVYSPTMSIKGGFGCPKLFANSEAAASAQSENYSISAEHIDVDDETGEHFAGAAYGGKETYGAEYVGTPILTPATGFILTSSNASDSNSEFDKTSVSYEKMKARD